MTYNKETGDVTIHDVNEDKVAKKLITGVQEVFDQKKNLFNELNLDETTGLHKEDNEDVNEEELSERLKR